MKHGVLSSPALPALLAAAATLAIAGVWIFAVSDAEPASPPAGSSRSAAGAGGASSHDGGNAWLWMAAIGAAGLYGMFRYVRRSTRNSWAGNGAIAAGSLGEPLRMQAADQLRDALAIFNRQTFNCAEAADNPAVLYRAFATARVELQKRNARFMYDAIGAAHIRAVQRMLTGTEEDLDRHWPRLAEALKKLPDRAAKNEIASIQEAAAGDYNAVLAYLRLLRPEVREELVHAELCYRRLVGS